MNTSEAILPSEASFLTSPVLMPIASARIWKAGTPCSVNWFSSPACTTVAARIWPSALVIESTPTRPVPIAAAADPTAVRSGRTSCAAKPNAIICFEACSRSGNSNGVVAANCFISARKAWAFSADPSIDVNAIVDCSRFELKPMAASAPALKPEVMVSKIRSPAARPMPEKIDPIVALRLETAWLVLPTPAWTAESS
jgi:hypothetical protein